MIPLYEKSNRLEKAVNKNFKRFLYHTINWNGRLIEISGSRGVGKTTLMLQKLSEYNEKNAGAALYISADDPWFFTNSLVDTAEEFEKWGGQYLFIDEVHKYPSKHKNYDWSAEIKHMYDSLPGLNIVYSGSSILKLYIGHGDLSRRKIAHKLPGLSFREYLEINNLFVSDVIPFDDLLKNHEAIAADLVSRLKILPHFRDYLHHGYYPFYNEAPQAYFSRLDDVIGVVLETDIPAVSDIPFETSIKLKKLLALIAQSAPFTPNLSQLGQTLFITDQRTMLKYINFLHKAEMVNVLGIEGKGNQLLRKPDKLYLNNTNLMYCFSSQVNVGTQRETFFLNQLQNSHVVTNPYRGDFVAENQSIPLWLFGFLY